MADRRAMDRPEQSHTATLRGMRNQIDDLIRRELGTPSQLRTVRARRAALDWALKELSRPNGTTTGEQP